MTGDTKFKIALWFFVFSPLIGVFLGMMHENLKKRKNKEEPNQ